jgi:hypothetical protein
VGNIVDVRAPTQNWVELGWGRSIPVEYCGIFRQAFQLSFWIIRVELQLAEYFRFHFCLFSSR